MLRIFSDQLRLPVFAMQLDSGNETLQYKLPESVKVIPLENVHGVRKLYSSLLPNAVNTELKSAINEVEAVFLRQPLWECWPIYKYARRQNKEIAVSFHGDWPDSLQKASGGFARKTFQYMFSRYIRYVYMDMAKHSRVAFFVGEALSAKYGGRTECKYVFANFLHSSSDVIDAVTIKEIPPYTVLFVGGLEEYKGVRFLIEAIAVLRRRGLEVNLRIVGVGSQEQALKQLARELGIDANISWLGYVQYGEDLNKIYRSADIFVLPSIASEGMPKVVMEALSQGVPVVATDIGSTPNLLEFGRYGVLVHSANSGLIAESINNLLESPAERRKYIDHGLTYARASTKAKQEAIVKQAISDNLPNLMGSPDYLEKMDSGKSFESR